MLRKSRVSGDAWCSGRTERNLLRQVLAVAVCSVGCGGTVAGPEGPDASSGKDGSPEAARDASLQDATVCVIAVSNYDTSCSTASDCVYFGFGNFCTSQCTCPTNYINKNAVPQYNADFSKTPIGMGAISSGDCNCPGIPASGCCQNGECGICNSPRTEPDGAPTDAIAYVVPDGSPLCSSELGPVDAAVSDAGQLHQCIPPETCVAFNGGWACCTTVGPADTLCH